jgi:cytochrome c biogenesis protein CcmG, thiol:disulfide interchange protein DsbE
MREARGSNLRTSARRALRTSALALAAMLASMGCRASLPPSIGHPLVGAQAPPFNEATLDEREVSVPGYLSTHVTVIDFWASWCGTCQETMPALEALYRDRRNEGLVVVGVSVDENEELAARGAEALGASFPIVFDEGQRLAATFAIRQVPTTFVVDRAGVVRWVGSDPASVRRAVAALLDE